MGSRSCSLCQTLGPVGGQVNPIVLRRQQLELGYSKVLWLPPQLAVELQDLALLRGQQNIYFTYQRCLFFWPPTHLAIMLT